ncbi:MAG TPA: hypothetical protein VGN89_14330, partial [Phenylobacterium sp.]|nr:hypothetical protein [Phenylobacterium sp.]
MSEILAAPKPHPSNQDFVWRETDRRRLRRLTPDQVDQFDALGFFKLEGVFTAEELARVAEAIDPLEAEGEE